MLSTRGDLQGPDDANRALQARVTIPSRWEDGRVLGRELFH